MMNNRIVAESRTLGDLGQDRINSGFHSNQEPALGIKELLLAKRFVRAGSRSTPTSGERDSTTWRLVLRRVFSLLFLLVCALPTGLLAQTAAMNPLVTSLGSGLKNPQGVAVDAAGNVYIADTGNYRVVKVPADGGPQSTVFTYRPGSAESTIWQVTVDSAGNLYIPLILDDYIVKIPADGGPQTIVGSVDTGLIQPGSVAVDGAGDLFIADIGSNKVLEMPAGGGSQIVVASGLKTPESVAVDSAGDVFIADWGDSRVLEVPAGGGAQISLGTGWTCPAGIAVDRLGNVFVSDPCKFGVTELPAGGGAQTNIGGWAGNTAWQVAADGEGDVFIAGYNPDTPPYTPLVVEVQTNSANLGSADVCPPGQSTPAPCSQTVTLNYTVTSPADLTVGGVYTLGASSLDFNLAAGTTCGVVTTGTSCTVNVTFTPTQTGLREGAIQIVDGSGNVLATTYLHGIGTGPQIAFASASQTTVGTGLQLPIAITMDGAGDLYIADTFNQRIVELPAGGGAQVATGTGGLPFGVAVDGAGDLFIVDFAGGDVVETSRSGSPTTVTIDLKSPVGAAVDGVGDLFIADQGNNRVVEVSPGSNKEITVGVGLAGPAGVAVDAAGDVFIADTGNDRVVEVSILGGAPTTIGTGLSHPAGVAVDAAGDVFIADTGNNRVVEAPAGGGAQIELGSGLNQPYGVFVAGNGDVYIADTYNSRVVKLPRSQPPVLSFAATEFATTSVDSPETVVVENVGNQSLKLTDVSYPVDFPVNFFENGSEELCIGMDILIPGQACDLSINFTPLHTGALTESLIITDNSLNGAPATQTVSLGGTGVAQTSAATIASPASGLSTVLGTTNVAFQWTTGAGVTEYQLNLSAIAPGESELFLYKGTATSAIARALPANGAIVYATLYSKINGVWLSNAYEYTESGTPTPATLNSPPPGLSTKLGTSDVTFQWSSGGGVSLFQLNLSAVAPGRSELFLYKGTALSATIPTLPANGVTVYATLYSLIKGTWQSNSYVYTESGSPTPGALTSPTPGLGTTLGTSSVLFEWNAGTSATLYQLNLSAIAPGNSELFLYKGTALSATAPTLPANGAKVYARLYSYIDGIWLYNDYVYTEQ
jgi:sugar lactone lactonase YvrE